MITTNRVLGVVLTGLAVLCLFYGYLSFLANDEYVSSEIPSSIEGKTGSSVANEPNEDRSVDSSEELATKEIAGKSLSKEASTKSEGLSEDKNKHAASANREQKIDQPKQVSSPKPLLDWNTDRDTYLDISRDGSLPDWERENASRKVAYSFARWRGRNSGQLGGFEFEPDDFATLSEWKESSRESAKLATFLMYSVVQPICVERTVILSLGSATLTIGIRVAVSVGWAHEILLNDFALVANDAVSERWGDLNSIEVGDVWFAGKLDSPTFSGRREFTFARQNVIVDVCFTDSDKIGARNSPVHLDLMALAREFDSKIIGQSLSGGEWSDLTEFRPNIIQFWADTNTLEATPGIKTPIRLEYEPRKVGDEITLHKREFGGVSININSSEPYAKVCHFLETLPPTSRCWLVAINERNLLFSVAEIEFTLVKPD